MAHKEVNKPTDHPKENLSSPQGYEWYALKIKKGTGKNIIAKIQERMQAHGLDNMLKRTHNPTYREYVVQNGKRRLKEHRFGHIMVELSLVDSRIKDILRSIEGLNGFFVFPTGYGWKETPVPLNEEEVERMLVEDNIEKPTPVLHDVEGLPSKGQSVKIISGPFKDMEATVQKIDLNSKKVEVIIKVFKKDTPVSLHYNQIKRK
ncbi:MAG: transcription termination/antitermination protein NusG [Bacteroidota bacterium]